MKKCMICGGQTLPGAKLCLPCRAALRRARDDTISELLPLPRRRDAFGYAQATSIAGALPLAGASVAAPPRRVDRVRSRSARRSGLRRLTPAHFRTAAVASFAVAAGVLAFIAIHQIQRDRVTATPDDRGTTAAADLKAEVPRVSPASLLGTARSESPPPAADTEDGPLPLTAAPPPASAKKPKAAERPVRTKPVPARAPTVVEFPAVAAAEPIVIRAAPEPPPASRAPAPDRGQLFAAALAKCSGDFFTRTLCEHRTRAQFCEGQWGQHALCPAGITNDHGQ